MAIFHEANLALERYIGGFLAIVAAALLLDGAFIASGVFAGIGVLLIKNAPERFGGWTAAFMRTGLLALMFVAFSLAMSGV